MKRNLLFLPLAALALLSSCELLEDGHGCTPRPSCTAGTVLGHTCMAGTLIQLHGAKGGQTIQYDADGTGPKTYHHVISTYTSLGTFDEPGTTLYFGYQAGGARPDVQCLANDAPATMQPYTLSNLSGTPCGDEVHTQDAN
jgi:hypothetical protein